MLETWPKQGDVHGFFLSPNFSPEGCLAIWLLNYTMGTERQPPRETLDFWPKNPGKRPQWAKECSGWIIFSFYVFYSLLVQPWSQLTLQRNTAVMVWIGTYNSKRKPSLWPEELGREAPGNQTMAGKPQTEVSWRRSSFKSVCESVQVLRSSRAVNARNRPKDKTGTPWKTKLSWEILPTGGKKELAVST